MAEAVGELSKMTTRTRLLILCISTPVLAFALVGGVLGKTSVAETAYQHLRVFEDVVSLIINNYVEDVEVGKVMEGAMRGLSDGLDPDSAYLEPAQVKSIEAGEPLPEGVVGLELTRQFYLRVIAARDGSPAARAGLQTGDYVRAIEGRPTRDMSVHEGMRLLRGAPGTKVSLTVIRGNAADPHPVELVREKPSAASVTGRIMAGDVGYIRIAAFAPDTAEQLKRQATELTRTGASRLVIDLRRTAEGPLDAGLAAARLFVAKGTLAILSARGATRETISAAAGDGAITTPAVLLTSNGTGGAAELFVAALAGNDRAEVIGERTLGRAGLQKLVKLPEGRGLWLTWARYLTPEGDPIHGRGLTPDIEVEEPEVEFGAARGDKDPILDRAFEHGAKKKAA
jgi:carboxyl-terminal processing protease